MSAISWQGAQDGKRSDRPRPVSAGAAARNHAPAYDMKLSTALPSIGHLIPDRRIAEQNSLKGRNASKISQGPRVLHPQSTGEFVDGDLLPTDEFDEATGFLSGRVSVSRVIADRRGSFVGLTTGCPDTARAPESRGRLR